MVFQSFRKANLRGKSFKGKEFKQADFSKADLREVNFDDAILEGTNFSGADLRGAKFSNAKLKKANFSSAKTGLQIHDKFIYLFISFLLVFIAGITSGILANLVGKVVENAISQFLPSVKHSKADIEDYLYLLVISISLFIVPVLSLFRGIKVSIVNLAITIILIISLAFFKEILIPGKQANITFCAIILPLFIAIFLVIIGIEALAFNLIKVVSETKIGDKIIYIAMFVTLVVTISTINSYILSDKTQSQAATVLGTAIYETLLICFLSWKSIEKDKEWSWAYRPAIAFAAIKGTNFHQADLTDTNFTEASLKNTDFRGAILTCSCWLSVQGLEHARLDTTCYLQKPQVRDLVIKKLDKARKFINQDFRDQDLRGINLQGFDLQYFNFTDADLRQSNLENVNLHNAKLVRTKLDQANLNNACLTGAYIQDWIITRNTQWQDMKCEYIYLRDPTKNDPDPHRMPPSNEGNFKGDDFHNFINSILDTLKLYHDQDINATVAIEVLKAMTKKYPEVKLQVVGVEQSGDKKKSVRFKLINDGGINRDQLEKEYDSMYEQTLNIYDSEDLMSNKIYKESIVINGGQVYEGGIHMINDHSRTQNINNQGGIINNSGAGAFNLGDISGTVANTINQLPDSSETDQPSIKELLTQLKEAIETEPHLSDEDKAEALEQLGILAEAGKNFNEAGIQKTAKGAMRILKGLAAELPTATKLVEGISKLLPAIALLLGIRI
ncbi:pentapeptide repeat-containing protein [Nostoc sp.]|uniref:pentapeptide repeat-containing protein n=1 Tax=Nostoc sp. TaxID=1180 RepID=UPI002FFAE2CB